MMAHATRLDAPPFRTGFYFGWIQVVVAALAMVATFPGRTQGLGLVTEPLLADLHLDAVTYASIHLWATLVGALFAPAAGLALDRFGSRSVLTFLSLSLGAVVAAMSAARSVPVLAVLVLLTRGLGQSALSAASITLVGQWFRRRLPTAMAAYSLLLSIGFMAAFPAVEFLVRRDGWRPAWFAVGVGVALIAPVAFALVRRSADSVGLDEGGAPEPADNRDDLTLRQALGTPAFWIVGIASSLYLLVASGIGLFNERILAELGFGREVFVQCLILSAMTGLAGNFLGGWLAGRCPARHLLAGAMALLAAGLAALPHLHSRPAVYAQAVVMGVAGGLLTVVFFAVWGREYGRLHLGRIQGAAQAITVVGSALGPLALAQCHAMLGSHAPLFRLLALVVAVVAVLAWRMPPVRGTPFASTSSSACP